MSAVGMVARSQLRHRWRGVVAVTLLVGVVGAVVIATVAGTRRTDSALPRFNDASHSSSVQVFIAPPTRAQLRAFERLPEVKGVAALNAFYIAFPSVPNLNPAAALDTALGTVVDRPRIIAGRNANPAVADEITIGESLAADVHKGVGDTLDAVSYTPAQANALTSGAVDAGSPAGPKLHFRIVGIVRRPLDLGRKGSVGGVLALTPAFNRKYASQIGSFGTGLLVRTAGGGSDVRAIGAAARRIFGRSPQFSVSSLVEQNEGAESAISVLTAALWIFAAVAALAGVVAIGIVLSRELALAGDDQATLHALGLTRPERVATSVPETLFVALGGALVAALGAVAASPLFPIGIARRAEPHLGLQIDWAAVGLGVVALVGAVLVIACIAALRTTRRSALHAQDGSEGRSTIAELAARAGMAPTMTNGLRMALEPGRGRTAVPVRSAFLGAIVGVLGVTAIVVFASSLNHLAESPRLYGWTYDFRATDTVSNETSCTSNTFGAARVHGIGALTAACYGTANITLDGRGTNGWAFIPVRGQVDLSTVKGRGPRRANEVALGSATLRALGKHIGDRVKGAGPHGRGEYRIVGQVVFPTLGQAQPLDDGAAFTGPGFAPLFDQNNFYRYLLGRFTPGADRAAVMRRVGAIPELSDVHTSALPVEVDRLRQIGWFPATLAAVLALLALIAVGHALVTAVRRRRRDLALLKTLGFERAQVRRTVAYQATTLAAVGLVVGLPVGLVIGRLVWHHIADGLGVATAPTFPMLEVIVLVPVVLALVNLLAFLPARSAARIRPAVALRAE